MIKNFKIFESTHSKSLFQSFDSLFKIYKPITYYQDLIFNFDGSKILDKNNFYDFKINIKKNVDYIYLYFRYNEVKKNDAINIMEYLENVFEKIGIRYDFIGSQGWNSYIRFNLDDYDKVVNFFDKLSPDDLELFLNIKKYNI